MGIESQPRTYEPVKLRFKLARPVCQMDRRTGQTVPRDQATQTLVVLDAEMELRELRQSFEVLGKIEKREFDEKKLECKAKAALAAGLPRRVVLDFFKLTEITVEPDSPELGAWEAGSTLDGIHAPHLEEQAKAGNEAAKAWRAAIDEACNGIRNGFEYNRSKVKDAIMFVERCHRAANNGMMQTWCEEKLGRIRGDLTKLATYKNQSHPNALRTANDIAGLLRSWPVVNSWHETPPRRPAHN